ncbi:MAG: MtnX-like HAD-IB family phosphatase [Bacteroidetes bacterium]|nr:MtnX-like HAD-IB family phosphatase [Bacteroidota bacterium]MCL5033854.1 MtnX-like HAD-IB family phosphatase [Bacteroidota bacterium]
MSSLFPKVFVDFDGTITTHDVGNEFFRKFGNEAESLKAVAEWKSDGLSGRDLILREAGFVKTTQNEALEFAKSFTIDSFFSAFVDYCRQNEVELTILSDGLDFYISEILSANHLSEIPFYSNIARFDTDTIKIEFPYESTCPKCANCKGHQILTRTGIDDLIVYVGNGFSDRCAVDYADIIFAKDDLLKYCEANNITFFPFEDFSEVLSKFRKTFESKKFRKRHRAELKRREAYLSE